MIYRSHLLLFVNKDRFFKIGIYALEGFFKDVNLKMLTSQTQNRCPGYIRIIDITRQKLCQGISILPNAAAATLVGNKFNLYLGKHALLSGI